MNYGFKSRALAEALKIVGILFTDWEGLLIADCSSGPPFNRLRIEIIRI